MYKKLITLLALVTFLMGSASASAGLMFNYDRGAGVFGGNSGLSYDSVNATYDQGTEDFSFTVDYNGAAAEGGWLVISPGPNPKNSDRELGIAYFDAASGNTWIYAYNGLNNNASYQTMQYLGFFEDSYTTVNGVASLAFNASSFSGQLDTGFSFGNRIGIWFHPSANLNVNGDSGGLDGFHASSNGWLDTNNDGDCNNPNTGCVTTVPEPATWLLFAAGAGLLVTTRRRALNRS